MCTQRWVLSRSHHQKEGQTILVIYLNLRIVHVNIVFEFDVHLPTRTKVIDWTRQFL